MRVHIPCAALGLTLVAALPAAAQTSPVVTAPSGPMATEPPPQIAGDATTTRNTRPVSRRAGRIAGRRAVATRRSYPSDRAVPAAGYDYDDVAAPPAPPVAGYDGPVYDLGPAPVEAPAGVVAPVEGPAVPVMPAYQYIYQPDRILVVDPVTGIAMRALPR